MKVYDILPLITDVKITINLIELSTSFDYGRYTKELLTKSKLYDKKIKKLDIQYLNNKRILKLYI